jgi:flagellar hook-basal body complex protein FliE
MQIDGIGGPSIAARVGESGPSGGEAFAKALGEMVQNVNQDQVVAADEIRALAVDGEGSIHEAMVAVSRAEGSFRLMMEVRNRIVTGVNELLRTAS